MNLSPGSARDCDGYRYRVGVVVGAAQRAGVHAVRRAAYRQATEFDWKDEAQLAWSRTDDEGTVIALWDAQGQVLSTVRANVFTELDPAEDLLEYSLAGIDACTPVLVLSRAATHPGVARQGFNSIVRYAYLAAAAASRMACVVTLVGLPPFVSEMALNVPIMEMTVPSRPTIVLPSTAAPANQRASGVNAVTPGMSSRPSTNCPPTP